MKKYIIILIVFIVKVLTCHGQSKDTTLVSKKKISMFQKYFRYKLTADGFISNGNVNRVLFVGRGNFTYIDSIAELSLLPTYTTGSQNGLMAEDDYTISQFSNIRHDKKLFYWSLLLFEHSRLRGILERHNYGGGIGWNIFKRTETQNLSITSGLIYEKTDFNTISDRETWRSTTRIKGKHKVLHHHVKFIHETFIQPSLLNSFDLRWRTILSIEAPVSHHISFRTAFQNTFESIIQPGKVRNDYNITFGLAISN